MIDFIKEFLEFLKVRKKYWLLPIIIARTTEKENTNGDQLSHFFIATQRVYEKKTMC